ncbi:MAG: hypothetical protein KDC80_16095 [Saprospiraceae bacterium]|nr:hypothetical protein [Saprospiraceae bacterium]
MKNIIVLFLGVFTPIMLTAQEFNQDFDAQNIRHLLVANIHGDIKISASGTSSIKVRTTQEYRDVVANDYPSVAFLQQGDTLALYIRSDCNKFSLNRRDKYDENRWGYYNWDNCKKNTMLVVDFDIEVPFDILAILSTINEGDILVKDVRTPIWANNINGSISLKNIREVQKAHTINGNVDLEFNEIPDTPGFFYTLNGDINAYLPKDLSANVTFKTFQGDFYTNFNNAQTRPASIEAKKDQKGFIYRLGGKANIQINQGGVNLDFETFNGNVYLRTI